MNEYPLTLEHVKAFLATKQDDDVIGVCFNSMYCLLSETLNWLYPEKLPWRVDIGSYDSRGLGMIPPPRLDERLDFLRRIFDSSRATLQDRTVTKAHLRKYLVFSGKMTELTVADLFEE